MTKRIVIPVGIANEAADRAGRRCECDNPDCDHAARECSQPTVGGDAGAAFVGPMPASETEMRERVRWMCGPCRSKTLLPILEQA